MEPWQLDRFGSLERGENPTLLMKMKSGFAVMADYQFLPGYCILLAYPKVGSLNELPLEARAQFLMDMHLIGDAIQKTYNPLRLNYAIMANFDHFLHVHIHARYDWEPAEYSIKPAFAYPNEQFFDKAYFCNQEKYGEMKRKLVDNLQGILNEISY